MVFPSRSHSINSYGTSRLKVDFLLVVSEGHKRPVCLRPLLDRLRFTVQCVQHPKPAQKRTKCTASVAFPQLLYMFKLFKLKKFHLFSPMSSSLRCGGWNFITHGRTNKALDNTVTLHGLYASGQFSKRTSQLLKMEIRTNRLWTVLLLESSRTDRWSRLLGAGQLNKKNWGWEVKQCLSMYKLCSK